MCHSNSASRCANKPELRRDPWETPFSADQAQGRATSASGRGADSGWSHRQPRRWWVAGFHQQLWAQTCQQCQGSQESTSQAKEEGVFQHFFITIIWPDSFFMCVILFPFLMVRYYFHFHVLILLMTVTHLVKIPLISSESIIIRTFQD